MLRECSVEDIPYLIPILEQVHSESERYKDMVPEPDHVADQISFLIEYKLGIVLTDDKRRAVMLGCVSQPWYSSRLEGAEFILAVAKEHRGGLLAARMIKEFVSQCRKRGACRVHAGATLGINDALARQLYQRLGFAPFGAGLVKEL